ncbi:hypothetical protein [Methylomicrobium lacus]|uniref:hypothetical protein n=1 Tax=Methylomicrobium lacus TaxID=136992 RepID=UPI0035A999F2
MYNKLIKNIGVVLMSLITLIMCAEAQARPSKEVEVTFVSDASLKTEVGYQHLPCDGGIMKSGKRTNFYVRSETVCENTHLPSPAPINCNFTQAGCKILTP